MGTSREPFYFFPRCSNRGKPWFRLPRAAGPGGTAGFVMANGSLSANRAGEGDLRENLIGVDLVD